MTVLIRLAQTDIGANASAEEAGEDLDDAKVKVNNIVASFRLQSTQFDKKSFLTYLKGMTTQPDFRIRSVALE